MVFATNIYGTETKRYEIRTAGNEPDTKRYELRVADDETEIKRYQIGIV